MCVAWFWNEFFRGSPDLEISSVNILVRRMRRLWHSIEFVERSVFGECCQWVLDAVRETVEWLVSHSGSSPSFSAGTRQI